jgi:glucose/arabinose dehydrogenase
VLLTVEGLEPNHNGGMLAFGPDGYLYIGTGDGGSGGDPHGTIGNGQALDTLLGKILRIDVNADTYTVPPDNPFVNQAGALPEIWSYGLRNPWRFSFDRATGDLYIGDVGQGQYEEIDFQPASSRGGENYGWRIMEGQHCFNPRTDCDMTGLVPPIFEYNHDTGCSVTGGIVYRGTKFPWLEGQYIFADYCTGVVRAIARNDAAEWQTRQVTTFDDTISSFGEDEQGEMYVVGHRAGTIYKLTSTR